MTGNLDRLADFYTTIFGAQILARSDGSPRKCFVRITPATSLHIFEVTADRGRQPEDDAFGQGSINHFALESADPQMYISTRARLVGAGRADETVYDAPGLYTIFASDPDGLMIELILRKTDEWSPPFATEPFAGLGQPAAPASRSANG
jgi:catechol 2,3-dioxygenase-like lactoylglutathione lyase family enzyme